jgi:hypothetical protein
LAIACILLAIACGALSVAAWRAEHRAECWRAWVEDDEYPAGGACR